MDGIRRELTGDRRRLALEIGRRLASARTRAGRSQHEAAAELGLAQSAIAKLEQGNRKLGLLEALDLAAFYGVPPTEFDPRQRDAVRQAPPPEEES